MAEPVPGGHGDPLPHRHEMTGFGDIHGATVPSTGGPLLVSAAGSSVVTTDGMLAQQSRLRTLASALAADLRSVDAAQVLDRPAEPSLAAVRRELDAARIALRSSRDAAEQLVASLGAAAAGYDEAERRASARFDLAASWIGAMGGPLLAFMAPSLALGGWLLPHALSNEQKAGIKQYLMAHPELITGTGFVTTVRGVTDGLDEATSSALGIPPIVAFWLGAAGITGVRTSARTITTVGPVAGVFSETPVQVQRMSTARIDSAPAGAVQRLDRIPEGNQVRIERYDAPDQPPRYVVYVGPTETFSPARGDEPWDLTSNVGGVGGESVGSFRASELAMRDAGIMAGDPVQFVGFSQGGLVAAMLASSGHWSAAGIQTFGGPTGNIAMPEGLTGMAVRNTDDFIPMLAGPQQDHGVMQVERQAFADGQPMPSYHAAPAHQRDAYRATAMAIDAARSQPLREQSAGLDAFTGDYARQDGSTITVMTYHGTRLLPEPVDPREVLGQ